MKPVLTGWPIAIVLGLGALACSRGMVNGIPSVNQSTVSLSVLDRIEVTPPIASLPVGVLQDYVATAVYSDGATEDITALANWQSLSPAAAAFGTLGAGDGQVLTQLPSTIQVQATWQGKQAQSLLVVTAASLSSIAVTPIAPSLPLGMSRQYIAIGTYSNGTTLDISSSVTWSTDHPSIATISNLSGLRGWATGVAAGITSVTATFGAISGSTPIDISTVTLLSIGISIGVGNLPAGFTGQFTAIGTYSDGSTLDITASVNWNTSNAALGTIGNTSLLKGLFNALAPGNVTVTATLGLVSGSYNAFPVTTALLNSITVTPNNPTVHLLVSINQQFTATGHYSDGSSLDITEDVTWESSAMGIVLISNAAGSRGLSTSLLLGDATITARLGAVSGSTLLNGIL